MKRDADLSSSIRPERHRPLRDAPGDQPPSRWTRMLSVLISNPLPNVLLAPPLGLELMQFAIQLWKHLPSIRTAQHLVDSDHQAEKRDTGEMERLIKLLLRRCRHHIEMAAIVPNG